MFVWVLQYQKLVLRAVNKKLGLSLNLIDLQFLSAYSSVYHHYGNVTQKNIRNYFYIILATAHNTITLRLNRLKNYEKIGLFKLEGDQVIHTPLYVKFIHAYEIELKKKIKAVKKRAKERGIEMI